MDEGKDIALMGFHIDGNEPIGIHKISYPFGEAKKLEWGSFVYMIGYPKGVELITKGIVSSPDRDGNGSFLLDAEFNRGFSGGVILAIKDGAPNFEIVGIANSAYSDDENILVPAVDWRYDENIPYHGDVYVRFKHNINYGLSQAVPSEAILRLIRMNQDELEKKGYDLKKLLEPKPR
jgi:S1-C subfamily serine protease